MLRQGQVGLKVWIPQLCTPIHRGKLGEYQELSIWLSIFVCHFHDFNTSTQSYGTAPHIKMSQKIWLILERWNKIFVLMKSRAIGLMSKVFVSGRGDRGSIPGRVIPKTQKMVLDASLLNTQHYKVWIKGKMEQSRKRTSALPYTSV